MARGIYAIRNTVTGDVYIGSAENIRARWNTHCIALRAGHGNRNVQQAIEQYGLSSLVVDVVERVPVGVSLVEREQFYIDTLNPAYNQNRIAIRRGMSDGTRLPNLLAWRAYHKLTQRALAEKAHVGFTSISRAEQGHKVTPRLVKPIAEALGMTISQLVDTVPADQEPSGRGRHNSVELPHLRAWRRYQGLTARDLAIKAAVHRTRISRIESGCAVRLQTARAVASALGLTESQILIAPPSSGQALSVGATGSVKLPTLRAWRLYSRLPQRALAVRAGVAPGIVSRIERDQRASAKTIDKLSKALGITSDQLVNSCPESDSKYGA